MYESKNITPEVKSRIAIEKRIVVSTVGELLKAGFSLAVYNGGEELETPITKDVKKLHNALMEADDDYLFVYKPQESDEEKRFGWIHFVYGNDGWDVMSDNTVNLDEFMPKTLALIERLG